MTIRFIVLLGLFNLGLSTFGYEKPDASGHWAFQPVKPLPTSASIDGFVRSGLEANRLSMSPPADKHTLIRRAAFGLTGLPPAPETIKAFLADESPEAFARVVDRLLASPHYGERWGRYWLDVARYADTKGYVFQEERRYPYAYAYRDWVIQALNDDMPYDRFLQLQLAADQLVDEEGSEKAHLAAMGFLTLGRRFLNKKEDIIDDRIDVVTRGTLGLTVSCARCHDHPNDPIPTADYYSLYGVFNSSEEPEDLPLLGDPPDTEAYRMYKAELDKRLGEVSDYLEMQIDRHRRPETIAKYLRAVWLDQPGKLEAGVFQSWKKTVQTGSASIFEPWRQRAARPPAEWGNLRLADALNPVVRKAITTDPPDDATELIQLYAGVFGGVNQVKPFTDPGKEALRQVVFSQRLMLQVNNRQRERLLKDRKRKETYRKKIKAVHKIMVESAVAPPRGMILRDKETPEEPVIFTRGNPGIRGAGVPRRFLSLFKPHQEVEPFQAGSGRLELARAITDPVNPLTSRVLVNRVWMHHFGRGLVDAPSDFGLLTEPPSHPGLLDYLARRFVAEGWSLKKLHREILLSATWRQASKDRPEMSRLDPENRWLWRMNRRRLDFEAMRDSLLVAGNRLDRTLGGKPAPLHSRPYSRRRAVYGTIDRQNLPPVFRTFDFASPDAHTPKRYYTTMPQQALFMMNDPFVLEQARHMVGLPAFKTAGAPGKKVAALYRQALGRSPDPEERRLALEFLGGGESRWPLFAQALLCSNEFIFVD